MSTQWKPVIDNAKFTVCRVTVNISDQLAGYLSVRHSWGQVKGTTRILGLPFVLPF